VTDDAPDDGAPAPPAKSRSKAGGRYQKGKSGNPSGKRKGTRNRRTLLIEAMTDGDREAIIAKVLKLARAGDGAALKLVLDRIEPVRKGRAVRFPLPAIKTVGDVVAALAAIAAAMAAGLLSPAEALEVANVVELSRRALETQEIEARLHVLEGKFK
jgi:hypothetical protein